MSPVATGQENVSPKCHYCDTSAKTSGDSEKTIAGNHACDRWMTPGMGRPPPVPSGLDPEPSGSRRSHSGHIRYVRLRTRATATLWAATRTQAVGSRISGPRRTPQGTSFPATRTASDQYCAAHQPGAPFRAAAPARRAPHRASPSLNPFYASALRCQSRCRRFDRTGARA